MIKKIITVFLSALLAFNFAHADAKKSIVCSSFPYYDFTMNILGDEAKNFSVELLQESGMDLHSFQPTAEDFAKLFSADLFIYNGGNSEKWADDAAETLKHSRGTAVNLLESLGGSVKTAETVEGMQPCEHNKESECGHDRDFEHDHEDEHIWLSIKNAENICKIIAENIIKLDPENEKIYKSNLRSYVLKLDKLDRSYGEAVENAKSSALIFADRFPFRYMTDDYNIQYFAAFEGCSAESEASFETVAFLAKKLNELKLPCVIALDGSTQNIAKAVTGAANNQDAKILTLNSMQTINRRDMENGASYISIMEQNLETLKRALN